MTNARLLLLPLVFALGCDSSGSDPLPDAGTRRDTGTTTPADIGPRDTGSIAEDAGTPRDAEPGLEDVGVPPMDAGTPVDLGVDLGVNLDAGEPIDAGTTTATSCLALKTADPAASTGTYTILVGGMEHLVFCDMELEGGGWTMALVKNSAHSGAYPDFGASPLNVSVLGVDPAVASTSTIGIVAWLDLNATDYAELRLAAYSQGARSFLSESIARSSLRIAFGEPGYLLYDDPNGYYWCGGPNSYTDSGVGQVNQPPGAPVDCKTHTVLGSGWDFGGISYNTNMTMCGNNGYNGMLSGGGAGGWVFYPNPGVAYAIWIR